MMATVRLDVLKQMTRWQAVCFIFKVKEKLKTFTENMNRFKVAKRIEEDHSESITFKYIFTYAN